MTGKRVFYWKQAPFIRIVASFISGLWLQENIDFDFGVIVWMFTLLLVLIFVLEWVERKHPFRRIYFRGWVLVCFLLCSGMGMHKLHRPEFSKNWYGYFSETDSCMYVRIHTPPVQTKTFIKFEGKVISIAQKKVHGNIMLYVRDSSALRFKSGNTLLVQRKLTKIPASTTPGAFDYALYMYRKGFVHQTFLEKEEVYVTDSSSTGFHAFVFRCRDYVLNVLKHHFKNQDVRGVAEALLIGYKENLDDALLKDYTQTGVVHVIAISGLHLGLIYVALVFVLKRIRMLWRYKVVRTIIVLCALWLFSLMTGAPASVLRSAVMFTCLHVGETYFKKSSVYNTMCASAFLLLVYNPFFLWDPGFLLSYLAVLGIVLLQKPIEHLMYFKHRFVRMIWSMASVTLAAQIATLPVCIYYFHQFPTYFLISNLVVVPLSTLILFAEILLLFFNWMPGISIWSMCIEGLIVCMNGFIKWMSGLPFALVYPLYASVISTFILVGILISLYCAYAFRTKKALIAAACCLVGITLHFVIQTQRANQLRMLVMYNSRHTMNIDIIRARHHRNVYRTDSLEETDLLYHNIPARIHFRAVVGKPEIPGVYADSNGIVLGNKVWLWLNGKRNTLNLNKEIFADVLLVSHNYPVPSEEILRRLAPKQVVLDGSNSMWKIEQWKSACEQVHLPCHSIKQDGTFCFEW
jgi:competence protein ComEC